MKKYLKKLISNPNSKNSLGIKYMLGESINCGNGYKNGTKHEFYSDDPVDHVLLKEIFKRFRIPVTITNVKPNSFEFESATEIIQIFFFRICRYTRTNQIRKILEDTILINKAGVGIANAFLLAHYNNTAIPYYNDSMDIVYGFRMIYILCKPCKTLAIFRDKLLKPGTNEYIIYNYLYQPVDGNTNNRKLLMKLIKEKDWKAANKYLLSLFT